MNDKLSEILRTLEHYHDELKHHQFLLNFDKSYFKSFTKTFYNLSNSYFDWKRTAGYSDNEYAPVVIIKSIYHNLSRDMWEQAFFKDLSKSVGEVTIFIMLIHQIILGRLEEASVRNPAKDFGLEAIKNEDGTFRCVMVYRESYRNELITKLQKVKEYYIKHYNQSVVDSLEKDIMELKSNLIVTTNYKFY